jgi:hypothetical protein
MTDSLVKKNTGMPGMPPRLGHARTWCNKHRPRATSARFGSNVQRKRRAAVAWALDLAFECDHPAAPGRYLGEISKNYSTFRNLPVMAIAGIVAFAMNSAWGRNVALDFSTHFNHR